MEIEEFMPVLKPDALCRAEVHAVPLSAAFDRAASPGALHENPPHRLGRRAKEMPAISQERAAPEQAQAGLVYECGGLKCVPGLLVAEASGGDAVQLLVGELDDGPKSLGVIRIR
jgi:hypothetical protein